METKIVRGPVEFVLPDGTRYTHERTITTIDCWRTIQVEGIGPIKMNMGRVIMSPLRLIELEKDG